MADVGIRLSMTENVSAMSPKVSSALRDISAAGEDMKAALQLGDLEEKYRQFAERVDKLHDTQQVNKQQQQDASRQQREEERQSQQNLQRLSALPTQVVGGVGGAATRAGGGDVAGAGAGLFGMMQGMLKMLGPVGIAISTAGAGLFAGAAIEQQYEKQLPGIMALSAALGRLSDEVGTAGMTFKNTMQEVADTGAEFGLSLEASIPIFQQFARAGGTREQYVERAMEYGAGYGADPATLAGFLGTFQRFGGRGNILGTVAGGLEQSGMGAGRYQEFLESTLAIFEEGLSRGVSKGFEDIVTTQSWLAQLGEVFTGQTGLNTYRKLESATAGATALSREQDIILFRAAREAIGKDASYIDVMKQLEVGIDATIFENVRRQVMEMSTSPADQIESMRSIFGVGYDVAEKLMNLPSTAAAALVKKAPSIESKELDVMEAQYKIAQDIRNMGAQLIGAKGTIMQAAEYVIGGLGDILDKREERELKQKEDQDKRDFIRDEESKPVGTRFGTHEGVTTLRTKLEEVVALSLTGTPGVGGTEAAQRIKSILENLPPDERHALNTAEVGPLGSGVYDYLATIGWQHMAPGEKTGGFVAGDLPRVLEELIKVLNTLGISIEADKTMNITVEEAPIVVPGGGDFTR